MENEVILLLYVVLNKKKDYQPICTSRILSKKSNINLMILTEVKRLRSDLQLIPFSTLWLYVTSNYIKPKLSAPSLIFGCCTHALNLYSANIQAFRCQLDFSRKCIQLYMHFRWITTVKAFFFFSFVFLASQITVRGRLIHVQNVPVVHSVLTSPQSRIKDSA